MPIKIITTFGFSYDMKRTNQLIRCKRVWTCAILIAMSRLIEIPPLPLGWYKIMEGFSIFLSHPIYIYIYIPNLYLIMFFTILGWFYDVYLKMINLIIFTCLNHLQTHLMGLHLLLCSSLH